MFFLLERKSSKVSLTREPNHEALSSLGDGMSLGVDLRVHGVPAGRALPEPVEDVLLAFCPERLGFMSRKMSPFQVVITYTSCTMTSLKRRHDLIYHGALAFPACIIVSSPVASERHLDCYRTGDILL